MNFEQFSGYILAGGKSSRIGRDKAFLQIGEKTFIENAIQILEPICENRIRIVLNSNQTNFIEKIPQSVPHIFDIYENSGALGGIHAGLKDCQTEFAIILAVDLPFLVSDAIKKLCETAEDEKPDSVIPRQKNGKLQPLAAIYRVKMCLPKLEHFLEHQKDFAVNKFLDEISFIENKHFSEKDIFFNVNNPVDYKKIASYKSINSK